MPRKKTDPEHKPKRPTLHPEPGDFLVREYDVWRPSGGASYRTKEYLRHVATVQHGEDRLFVVESAAGGPQLFDEDHFVDVVSCGCAS